MRENFFTLRITIKLKNGNHAEQNKISLPALTAGKSYSKLWEKPGLPLLTILASNGLDDARTQEGGKQPVFSGENGQAKG